MIRIHNIVLHIPSGLYYKCENKKMEKWMNDPLAKYVLVDKDIVPDSYFYKIK